MTTSSGLPFRLTVGDTFGVGLIVGVAGKVGQGVVRPTDQLLLNPSGSKRRVTVIALEQYRTSLEEAGPGQDVILALSGVRFEEISRGDVLEGYEAP